MEFISILLKKKQKNIIKYMKEYTFKPLHEHKDCDNKIHCAIVIHIEEISQKCLMVRFYLECNRETYYWESKEEDKYEKMV